MFHLFNFVSWRPTYALSHLLILVKHNQYIMPEKKWQWQTVSLKRLQKGI